MDFLIHLFGTSLKRRPKGYLNAGVASDSRLSRAGKTKDIRKAGIMRCQAGHAVIVNHIYSSGAGTTPPCFQEYRAPSSNVFLLHAITHRVQWEGGGALSPRPTRARLPVAAEFPGPCVDERLFAFRRY